MHIASGLLGILLDTIGIGGGLAWLMTCRAYTKSRVEAAVLIALMIAFAMGLLWNHEHVFYFGVAKLIVSVLVFKPLVRHLTPSPNG